MAKKDKNAEAAEAPSAAAASASPPTRAPGATSPSPRAGAGSSPSSVVLKLARGAGLPWPDAIGRGVLGGIVGYLAAWMIVQTIWRHIALAELEELRRRLIARAETQAAARETRESPKPRRPPRRPCPRADRRLSRGPHPTDRAAATAAPGRSRAVRRSDGSTEKRDRENAAAAAPAPRDRAGPAAAARRRAPAHRRPRLNLSSRPTLDRPQARHTGRRSSGLAASSDKESLWDPNTNVIKEIDECPFASRTTSRR